MFGLFEIFFYSSTCIEKFTFFNTHTKRKEKKRREKKRKRKETTFLIRLFTRTSSYTHKRHLKHIKERERDYSFVVLVPHTLFRLFLSFSFSLSLSLLLKRKYGGRGETSGAVGSREKEIRDVQSEKVIVKTTTTTTTTTTEREREREEGRGRNDDSDDDDDDT